MNRLKLSIAILLGAACIAGSISALKAATSTLPSKSETLLQRLVKQFRLNRAVIQMHQTQMEHAISDKARQELQQQIQHIQEKNRVILKRVALAGLAAAFVAALGTAAVIAGKKYGGKKAEEEKLRKARKEIEETPRPPMPEISNGEEVEHWKEEQKQYEKAGLYGIGDL